MEVTEGDGEGLRSSLIGCEGGGMTGMDDPFAAESEASRASVSAALLTAEGRRGRDDCD